MNILIDEFPTVVEIDGREVAIRSDFRTALRIILAFEDDDLTAQEKQLALLSSVFAEVPANTQAALERAHWFLNGGDPTPSSSPKNGEGDEEPRVYSFAKDAGLIFSAFRQTHGIDLETAQLHWWKFLALFMDLGADTAFCNLVGLRRRVKTGKATKEEREVAAEMGEAFIIPEYDTRTPEEKDNGDLFMREYQKAREERKLVDR